MVVTSETARPSSAKWHAARRPGSHSTSGGSAWEQIGWAIGQRGWNGHPGGGLLGSGGSPRRMARGRRGAWTEGAADINARVYGWSGDA